MSVSVNNHVLMQKLLHSTMAAILATSVPMALVSTTAEATTAVHNVTAAQRLNSLLDNIKSMSATFSQTTKGSTSSGGLGIKNGTFSGSMSIQRPNKFRWETKTPYEQLIVADNDFLWVYDKDLKQATRQHSSDKMGDTPALLLSGDPSQIANSFRVTQPDADKSYYVLYPKANDTNFESLAISFDNGQPIMMVLKDSLGRTTSIKFSNISINQTIDSAQFSFSPPAGIDVI